MTELKRKKYLHVTRKHFDPFSLALSVGGLIGCVMAIVTLDQSYLDLRGLVIVVGGTAAILLFQFDILTVFRSVVILFKSFFGTPSRQVRSLLNTLDSAILQQATLGSLATGEEINGDLLNDIVYMHNQGMNFEEIDGFVTARISDEFFQRQIAVNLLNRGAISAPALGLFGTVVGLVGVLRSLADPSQIGASMSLALMTTAYGALLGTLIFTPLAGRLEHHNQVYLETQKQILNKLAILLHYEDKLQDQKTMHGELAV
jgi:chemotaxis protein MotA